MIKFSISKLLVLLFYKGSYWLKFLYKDNYELLFIDYIPFKSCSWKLNKSFFLNEFLFEYYLSLGLLSS